jgi:nicotinamidase-related amidase
MDVILIVDMQVGLLEDGAKHDLAGVVARINALTEVVRKKSGKAVWIRHCGKPGDGFETGTPGWAFLPDLKRRDDDIVIEKTLNDPFADTTLRDILRGIAPSRVFITGWATDFCVDATVRSTVSNNHDVVVVSDAHTVSDRPHLAARSVIQHHHWLWKNLIPNRTIQIETTAQILHDNS